MPKAYSYVRFSSLQQEKGDSVNRQLRLAREYAAAHDLELDDVTYRDLGVPAFRGQNATEGNLNTFLEAVKGGWVKRGSYLLVESLDRISRQAAIDALYLLKKICEQGVTVITLTDGRAYDEKSLRDDTTSLLISILTFIRANEESATKSKRLRAAWSKKREKALSRPLTSLAPAWLELDKEKGTFQVQEQRAAVVRRIFESYLRGAGPHGIAKELNMEQLPVWGIGRKKGKLWHRSYVVKILENRAVLGEYTPHTLEYVNDKKKRVPLDPMEQYFPSIIDVETFNRVQELRKAKGGSMRGRKTSYPLRNILSGLAVCARCGSTVRRISKGKWHYLVCTKAASGRGCEYVSTPMQRFEDRLVGNLIVSARSIPTEDQKYRSLQTIIRYTEAMLTSSKNELENIISAMKLGYANLESSTDDVADFIGLRAGNTPKSIVQEIERLEGEIERLEKDLTALKSQQASSAPSSLEFKVNELTTAIGEWPYSLERVNSALRALCTRVVVSDPDGPIEIHFRHTDQPMIFDYEDGSDCTGPCRL